VFGFTRGADNASEDKQQFQRPKTVRAPSTTTRSSDSVSTLGNSFHARPGLSVGLAWFLVRAASPRAQSQLWSWRAHGFGAAKENSSQPLQQPARARRRGFSFFPFVCVRACLESKPRRKDSENFPQGAIAEPTPPHPPRILTIRDDGEADTSETAGIPFVGRATSRSWQPVRRTPPVRRSERPVASGTITNGRGNNNYRRHWAGRHGIIIATIATIKSLFQDYRARWRRF
jgi:hypothetical protein